MKTLTLYSKITTFLLLIWMYQCFYNCYSYRTWIDENILQTKNELKYERVLTEGNTEEKKQTNAEGCLKERPLDNEKNKCKNPIQYKNPYDPCHGANTPSLSESFDRKAKEMNPKLRDQKLNIECNKISANQVSDLHFISHGPDIPDEEKSKITDSAKNQHDFKLDERLCESNKKMKDNKTEFDSNKELRGNKTESESKKEMTENKAESESKKEQRKKKKKNMKFDLMKHLIFHKFDKIYDDKK
ncbi:fam-g protein [Plasmodium gallinaceum]|uniref:Fam-g protein n=1 Tax=Plasmodium gallinaceum TaxID=5849 RepID=A0A1J1GU59_PLAGA|nr:fam-g protein [Plasmodium gallinaceum]CRG96044.1 fam-g protein [Plasmodium gallinaceum]